MQSNFGLKKFQFVALVALLLTLALGVFTVPASADNLYASIKGTVADPTGAMMSGVKVMATNTATGVTYSAESNKDGLYNFLELPVGNYTVRAEQSGFKKFQASGIHIDLNQVYNLPIALTVGTVSEEIIVEANPVQVQQTDMQLGSTITGQQIVDIPLNGRNWTQLQQIEPGIVGTSDRFGGNNGAYSGNGAETQQNSFLINGVDSNDSSLNTALVIPSPDAISEFRLVTSTINPEFGRNSGTIINAQIKSGTNAFHGSGFEFYRDTFLDAKNYFEPTPSPFHQNEYGGTVGGPIIKDKAFVFFSYQGFRQKIPDGAANSVTTLTTDQYDSGIFAAEFNGTPGMDGNPPTNPNVSPVPLYGDASSTCPVSGGMPCPAGTPYGQYYSPSNVLLTNGLFSTGQIPTQNFDPLAQKLVNQFVPVNAAGLVFVSPVTVAHDHQLLGRVDFNLTKNDALWFYGLWETHPSQDSLPFTGSTLPGFPEQAQRHYQQYAFSWTHTFSPTTLNEFRLAYTRFNFAAVVPLDPINPTTYGFTGITPQNPAESDLPKITTPNFTLGFSNNGPQPRVQNVYQLIDNFSKVWGRHTFKAGIDVDRPSIDNPFFSSLNGNYAYNGSGPFSTGDGTVDFLLGFPDSYAQGSGSIVDAKAHEIYSYAQDQWQIRPNLTITYGTGYEVFTPWLNNYDHGLIMGAFHPGVQSTVFPTAPEGYVYPGDPGMTKYGGAKVRYDLLAPRFGFAWSPGSNKDWSIHGGIGLYYNRSEEELALQTLTNPPFAITSSGALNACGSVGFANPYAGATGACSTTNPFPFTPFPSGDTNINFQEFTPVGLGFTGVDTRFTAPRSTNFNLTVERQLDKATILSLAYVGNRGRHEEGALDLNLAGQAPGVNPVAAAAGCPIGYLMAFGYCPQTPVTQNSTTFVYTPGAPVAGATPYNLPVWGHPGEELTEFNSHYDSMQLTLNRRFSKGLQVIAAYTWSRYFDQTSSLEGSAFNFPGINQFCMACNWAPSDNDAPQRFTVQYTYTLPIYSMTHKWRRLTDDWTLSGIYTLQHGSPVAVFDPLSSSLLYSLADSFFAGPGQGVATGAPLVRSNPRVIQSDCSGNPIGSFWFTSGTNVCNAPAAAYATPNPGELGTLSRNPLYGPGINYGDMALEKRIHIDESRYFELRLETYNTFNHTNFANPTDPGFFNNEDLTNSFGNIGQVYTTKTISTGGEGRAVQLGAKFYF